MIDADNYDQQNIRTVSVEVFAFWSQNFTYHLSASDDHVDDVDGVVVYRDNIFVHVPYKVLHSERLSKLTISPRPVTKRLRSKREAQCLGKFENFST